MKLYGTKTSPFVRRVRVVAAEVGVPIELIDTSTDGGEVALREVSPIQKVPVAVVDGLTLFDSRVITEWLTTNHGFGGIAPPRDRWRNHNLLNSIDAALDAVISVYYLRCDGVAIDGTEFATREFARADAIFGWLATQLAPDHRSFSGAFGLPELSLICALDWMDRRKTYPTETVKSLLGIRDAWRDRPTLIATAPNG